MCVCVARELTRGSAVVVSPGDENPPPKGQHSSVRRVDVTNRTRGLAPLCTDQSRFAANTDTHTSVRTRELRALDFERIQFCILDLIGLRIGGGREGGRIFFFLFSFFTKTKGSRESCVNAG